MIFIEVPVSVGENSPVLVNPEHVVAITPMPEDNDCLLIMSHPVGGDVHGPVLTIQVHAPARLTASRLTRSEIISANVTIIGVDNDDL